MSDHFFYISSWYPQAAKSNGTFIEMQLLAMQEVGLKVAILQTEELSAGNFVRKRLRGERLFHYRPNVGIRMVENLVVHRLPLRFMARPEVQRHEGIIAVSIDRLDTYIRRHGRPDVLFHHGIFDFCYLTAALSAHFNIPYWYMEHSAFVEAGNIKSRNAQETESDLRAFVRGAERCFAVSAPYAAHFSALFGRSFGHVPNVLSKDLFTDTPTQALQPPFRFVNVGILEPHKQQGLLLEAFAKSFAGDEAVQLVIAGDGRLGPALQAQAAALGIAGQASLIGFVDRKALRQLLDSSHVLVLSSSHETFGVVLIEAMARGLPVIAPDIDGPNALVYDGVGTLFNQGSSDHLAAQMRKIKETIGNYAPAHIAAQTRERYGAKAFVKALLAEAAPKASTGA
jgi:glycosyltransferase involved in cell wall biosynthesis